MELCLVLIKPDAVELSLTGEILSHIETQDIYMVGSKVISPTEKLAGFHYYEHRDKDFYQDVKNYLTSKYHTLNWIYAFVYYGNNVCNKIRSIAGKTNPMNRGDDKKIITLRQKYGKNVIVKDSANNEIIGNDGHVLIRFENIMHVSESDMMEYEVKLWFSPAEILPKYRLFETKEVVYTDFDKKDKTKLIWEKTAEQLRNEIFK